MTRARSSPPRLAERMLERLIDRDTGSALLGDLLDGYAGEVERRGPAGARRWFWRETMAALWHFGKPWQLARFPYEETRMQSFLSDLRHGARALHRAPGFTSLVTVTLALAIGATAAVYSVVAPVLLRPLPYPHSDRLVLISERDAHDERDNLGYQTIEDIRRASQTLAGLAAYAGWSATIGSPGVPEQIVGQRVSWNYFDVLGVRMAHGRTFTPEEDEVGHSNVVVLSYGLWQRRFGGDSTIVGQRIRLGDQPYRVAGIADRSFDNVIFPDAQIWRVLGYSSSQRFACRTCRHLNLVARLRDGVPLSRAAAELDGIAARLVREFPGMYARAGMFVDPLQQRVTEAMRPALLAILSAAVLVLLVAAANVLNLQLARAVRRDGETAIRIALGASRARLAQQLFAESLVVAIAGGIAGLGVARAAVPLLVSRLPADLPRLGAIHVDLGAVAVTAAIVVVLAVVVGIAPVMVRRTRDVFDGTLRGATRVGNGSHGVARRIIVVAEVALALLLVSGTALVARSLVRLLDVDAGFAPQHVLTLRIRSSGGVYDADSNVFAYHARVLAAARRVPGVLDAGVANQLPLTGDLDTYGVQAVDRPLANASLAPYADRYSVAGDFMRAMSIRLIAGRAFAREDRGDSARVVIVSRSLAARLWPSENAVGKRLTAGNNSVRTVVGVASDVRQQSLDARTGLQFYLPERSWNSADNSAALVVRTQGDPASVADAVRAAVSEVDPLQPVGQPSTMEAVVRASTAERQLALTLFAVFGALALVLSSAGVFSVLAGSVAERTRELGLRQALGAAPRHLLVLVLRNALGMTVIGIASGLVATIACTRFIHALLFGIPDADPIALGGATVLLLLAALAASIIPALRAIRIDPAIAMRAD